MKNYKTPKGVIWSLCYIIILAALPLAPLWAKSWPEVISVYAPIVILFIYILDKGLDNIYDNE